MLDFSVVINRMENLRDKLQSFEKICGAGLIHDTRGHLGLMVNWLRNFDYYKDHTDKFDLYDWSKIPLEKYVPTQQQLDIYFNDMLDKAENFLADNVKKG